MAKSIFNHPVTKKAGLWGGGGETGLAGWPYRKKIFTSIFHDLDDFSDFSYFLVFGKKENKLLAALCKKIKAKTQMRRVIFRCWIKALKLLLHSST